MKLKIRHILLLILFAFAEIINAQGILQDKQNDIERANQILKELLPDKNYVVNESGIVESEHFSVVIDFAVNKQLERAVVTVDEKTLTLDLCCMSGMEENPDGTTTDYYYSAIYSIQPAQLPLAKELKTLIDSIKAVEHK